MDVYTSPEHHLSALITIDVQRDTLDGQSFEIAGTSAAVRSFAFHPNASILSRRLPEDAGCGRRTKRCSGRSARRPAADRRRLVLELHSKAIRFGFRGW
jgi:hypothetical protein